MPLSDLLDGTLAATDSDCWDRERTANALLEAELPADSFGYRTALSRVGLSGHVENGGRNHIVRWFQTLKQRTDRFYTVRNSGPASTRRWLRRFVHYYNTQRPHQALNGRIPAEVA